MPLEWYGSNIDRLMNFNEVEWIGDTYMCVCGIYKQE